MFKLFVSSQQPLSLSMLWWLSRQLKALNTVCIVFFFPPPGKVRCMWAILMDTHTHSLSVAGETNVLAVVCLDKFVVVIIPTTQHYRANKLWPFVSSSFHFFATKFCVCVVQFVTIIHIYRNVCPCVCVCVCKHSSCWLCRGSMKYCAVINIGTVNGNYLAMRFPMLGQFVIILL